MATATTRRRPPPRRNNLIRWSGGWVLCLFLSFSYVVLFSGVSLTGEDSLTDADQSFEGNDGRHLLGNSYPRNLISRKQREDGGCVLYAIGVFYMFVALAVVCDEFFVPALEALVEKYEIEDDVAGATFMAAGGSAPELFTSLIGVFIAESNVGFGTIIGSAVFNVLFVIGMCAIFSSVLLELTWWPLARDCSFYTMDLVILYIFFSTGRMEPIKKMIKGVDEETGEETLTETITGEQKVGLIQWWEAMIMLILYFVYVTFMKFNAVAEVRVKSWLGVSKVAPEASSSKTPPTTAELQSSEMVARISQLKEQIPASKVRSTLHVNTLQLMLREIDEKDPLHLAKAEGLRDRHSDGTNRQPTSQISVITGEGGTEGAKEGAEDLKKDGKEDDAKKDEDAEEEEDEEGLDLSWPTSWKGRINYVLLAPITYSLVYTLPNCRNEEQKKFFPVTFIGSILWIGFYSYWMVWWATEIGLVVGIPDEVMGLTFLAAGTSVPDLMSSVIVARQGLGDMAVSSSIGSNIFDITFGLPLPWFIWTLANGQPMMVKSESLSFSLVLLIIMLILVTVTIALSGWKMTKTLGMSMFGLYGIFLLLALLKSYDMMGALNDWQ